MLAREFRALRLSAVLRWVNVTMAVGFAAVGIGLIIAGTHAGIRALGALGLLDSALLTFVSVSSARQSQRIHRNAVTAMKLNHESCS